MKTLTLIFSLFLATAVMAGCSPKKTHTTVITAKLHTATEPLLFSGTIGPLAATPVTSPAAGTIVRMNFKYGQVVQKGETLTVVHSSKFESDYRDAITNFLQQKEDYETSKTKFLGTTTLWKAGIINRNAYIDAKNQNNTKAITYFKAKQQLEKILRTVEANSDTSIEKLSLGQTEEIREILKKSYDKLYIKSPADGIALFPEKDGDNTPGEKLNVGSEVKQGTLLVSVGDLSGLTIPIAISESNINRIKIGQPAIVTGDVFNPFKLHGKIVAIDSQAQRTSGFGGGLASFPAVVVVPHITPSQQAAIHIGMTAQVSLLFKGAKQLIIPIKSIVQKGDSTFVTVSEDHGVRRDVRVLTGRTTIDGVVIKRGLKPGQKIVVYD